MFLPTKTRGVLWRMNFTQNGDFRRERINVGRTLVAWAYGTPRQRLSADNDDETMAIITAIGQFVQNLKDSNQQRACEDEDVRHGREWLKTISRRAHRSRTS
ncbi:hypothetical protein PENNAL_c0006G10411 [Penicillium nalgiovense]|uniref:Uncharacterized protein n=1 Tax=Penicillium nalgiovense TaxID=60175 RepID=A0A1V6Z0M9_PENNA|nr:hypothetical protein PENNAL_c0006G10411 [Penicillium nalgiovense]